MPEFYSWFAAFLAAEPGTSPPLEGRGRRGPRGSRHHGEARAWSAEDADQAALAVRQARAAGARAVGSSRRRAGRTLRWRDDCQAPRTREGRPRGRPAFSRGRGATAAASAACFRSPPTAAKTAAPITTWPQTSPRCSPLRAPDHARHVAAGAAPTGAATAPVAVAFSHWPSGPAPKPTRKARPTQGRDRTRHSLFRSDKVYFPDRRNGRGQASDLAVGIFAIAIAIRLVCSRARLTMIDVPPRRWPHLSLSRQGNHDRRQHHFRTRPPALVPASIHHSTRGSDGPHAGADRVHIRTSGPC